MQQTIKVRFILNLKIGIQHRTIFLMENVLRNMQSWKCMVLIIILIPTFRIISIIKTIKSYIQLKKTMVDITNTIKPNMM